MNYAEIQKKLEELDPLLAEPTSDDSGDEEFNSQQDSDDDYSMSDLTVECKYGDKCYNKNPEHLAKYIH